MIFSYIIIFFVAYFALYVVLPSRLHQWKRLFFIALILTIVIQKLFISTASIEFLSKLLNSDKNPLTNILLFYPLGFMCLYILFTFVLSSKIGKKGRAVLSFLILLLVRVCNFDAFIFSAIESTKIPLYLRMLQGCIFFVAIVFILLALFKYLYLLIAKIVCIFSKKRGLSFRSSHSSSPSHKSRLGTSEEHSVSKVFSLQRRTFLKLAVATVPAVYGVKEAVGLPKVNSMEITSKKLPSTLDGLRIVQITDLHISPLFEEDWVKAVVERVNKLSPDLILFTGDMADGTPTERAKNSKPLADLVAKYGIFGSMGNHDYYSDFWGWMEMYPRLGITILENTHRVITINGANLVIAGVPDVVAEKYSLPMPDPSVALANIPSDAFCIMLDHRPINAAKNAEAGAHLQLSGHTHGGQILGMDLIIKETNNGFVRGWYTVNNMPMYVGSGSGIWNGFPLRLGVPAEIPCITLRSA